MWTFDNPPRAQWRDRYGFDPSPAWLDHLRLSSVRLNDGGGASFASSDGLLITNLANHESRDHESRESRG